MNVASGPLSNLPGSSRVSTVRRANQQAGAQSTGRVHINAETPTAAEARALTRAVSVVSARFPLKSKKLPDRVAPKGNQQSLMANRIGLPPWTDPTGFISSERFGTRDFSSS